VPIQVPVSGPPPPGTLNVAVTVRLEFMVTVQVPVPEHAPDQAANVEPELGVAVSVTTVPAAKLRQPEPHEVPAGEELTVPLPVPVVVVVRVNCCTDATPKVAVTVRLEFMVTVQVPAPEQAPDQAANVEPELGVAVSVTTVPAAKLRQPEPHEVPAGEEATVPLPVPVVVVVRVNCCADAKSNVAVRVWLELIVTEQAPLPEQAPLHPAKVEPGLALAVNCTTVPAR
jgi:hypothetical protein